MDSISAFVNRLKKIGIEVELSGNYPWIYLETVNGKRIKQRFQGNHGFTAFFLPTKPGQSAHITDTKVVFAKIREMIEGEEQVYYDEDYEEYLPIKYKQ